ncbi:putative quinol monooxygenase [Actinoplanes sp. CA-131856]
MSIFVRARFTARAGRQAEFEDVTTALTARAAQEPGTLTYRWFGPVDGEYLVIEQYADTPAAITHNERSADLLARAADTAEMVSAELYGTLGPELQAWVDANPQVTVYPDFPHG